jgi:rod shape-determining protein MreC
VYAQVISGEPSPYTRYLTINAGRRNGILEGMPVIGGGGALVGRVGRVSEATAMVQLLNDPASFINVQLVGSRATGTLAGQADGTLRLQNVLQSDTVTEGDLLVTSGLGGGLPPGMTVGQVDVLLTKDLATLKEASVRPGADYRRIEAVLVIKFVPPK